MYCRKCGKMISEDTSYCPYCGEKTDTQNRKETQGEDDIESLIGPSDGKMHLGTMLSTSLCLSLVIIFFLDWSIFVGIILFAAIFLVELFIAFCQGRRF